MTTVWASVNRERRRTRLAVSDVLDRVPGVDPLVMKIPAVSSSFSKFHCLESGRNLPDILSRHSREEGGGSRYANITHLKQDLRVLEYFRL